MFNKEARKEKARAKKEKEFNRCKAEQAPGNTGSCKDSSSDGSIKVIDRRYWAAGTGLQENEQPPAERKVSHVANLEKQISQLDDKLKTYIDAHKQVKTETSEFKDRLDRNLASRIELEKAKLLRDILELFDILEISIENAKMTQNLDALIEGLEMLAKMFEKKLNSFGAERVETEGLEFDPKVHEALTMEEVDSPEMDQKIVCEVRAGFKTSNNLLRAAQVKVGRYFETKSEENTDKKDNEDNKNNKENKETDKNQNALGK